MDITRLNKITAALCNMPMMTDRRRDIPPQWDIMEAESQAYFLELHMKEIHTVRKDDGLWHTRIQHKDSRATWYQGYHINRKISIAQAINYFVELEHAPEQTPWDDVDSYGPSA